MNAIDAARDFLAKATDLTGEALRAALNVLPDEVKTAYYAMRKASYFKPENANPESRKEHFSPSGKYKLVTTSFKTGPTSWGYTQGLVYRQGSDKPLAEVQRNYSSFPFLWVEDHPNGHPLLVCGADYQGQTVIELDTGERRDHDSDGKDKGHGFCWSSYTFEANTGSIGSLLVVEGCVWACPYEYRFFDFSDPMSGWPEIKTESYVDTDQRAPTFEDGLLKCYQTARPKEDEDDGEEEDEENKNKPLPPVAAYTLFYRDGLKFGVASEWVSDVEKERRIQRVEAERKYKEKIANFKATDPLYLTYSELVKDPALKPDSYESTGVIHSGWSPDYPPTEPMESRWCRRLLYGKNSKGYTVDLDWGMEKGPVKLTIFKDGKHMEDKFFPHSVEGMREAFNHTKECANAS